MARTKADGESISAMFKQLFQANNELLRDRDYDNLKAAFAATFPGKPFTAKHRQIAANIKSRMRKELGIRKPGRKKRNVAANATSNGQPALRPIRSALLIPLEEHVDECLMLARGVGREQLKDVIHSLKRARNLIIMMIGNQ